MDRMDRMDRAGRLAAYGAALAMTPYALIKISWVVGALAGLLPIGDGFRLTGWLVLNTATIGMAGIGIAMALALVRPWGTRIPGPLVVFVAWVGTGFLVPVLPFAVLDSLLGLSDGEPRSDDDTGPAMPGWEAALIQISFVGMGLGLAVALPAYLRRRWPHAFAGGIGGGGGGGGGRGARAAAGVAALIGGIWIYWALGGTAGVAHPADRGAGWRLLTGLWGGWALAAAAAAWLITHGRPVRLPSWIPLTLGWLGTGSLFAWSGWRLSLTLYVTLTHPTGAPLPETPALAVVLYAAAMTAGALLLTTLGRARRPAPPTPAPGR